MCGACNVVRHQGSAGGEPGRNGRMSEVAFSPMMDLPPDLPSGLYERIVTERLRERLSALDAQLVVRGPLDPADADALLVRTVGEALGRALRGIRGDGQERLAAQIALCNDVVAQLARSVPQAFDGPGDRLDTPHEILLALLVPPEPPAHPRGCRGPRFPSRRRPSSSTVGISLASALKLP